MADRKVLSSIEECRSAEQENESARDASLLASVCSGDPDAFGTLLRQWWSPLVRYCARITGSKPAAEDAVQEAFVRLWDGRAKWQPSSSPRAILYTVARNLALNQRKSGRVRERIVRNVAPFRFSAPALSVSERLEADEFMQALESAIAALPARQREVLTLSRFDGLTRHEIAEVTRLAPQTVANYLVAALAELRRQLAPFLREP